MAGNKNMEGNSTFVMITFNCKYISLLKESIAQLVTAPPHANSNPLTNQPLTLYCHINQTLCSLGFLTHKVVVD